MLRLTGLRRRRVRWLPYAVLAGCLCAGLTVAGWSIAWRPPPGVLWTIVHDRCAPHAQATGDPAPCTAVSLADGVAVLKDNAATKPLHYLLIPIDRYSGIEDPALLAPDRPNYWAQAWTARRFVATLAGRPLARDEVGLAVNSPYGRTQNQLHIHVACLKPAVRAALAEQVAAIGPTFAPLPTPLLGHPYRAMRLLGEAPAADPFRLAAGAGARMDRATLVLTGAVFAEGPGFIVLLDEAEPLRGDRGSGEELLAPAC